MIQHDIDLTLPLPYRYFILLPLRHKKRSDLLDIVCKRIHIYKQTLDCPSLRKFYTHTIQNYTELKDEIVYSRSGTWKEEAKSDNVKSALLYGL
jgi:hypothetical protein